MEKVLAEPREEGDGLGKEDANGRTEGDGCADCAWGMVFGKEGAEDRGHGPLICGYELHRSRRRRSGGQ